MRYIGTISYNIYCNFTNYGSALQTWALHQAINKCGYEPILVDYCPDILADKDPLNPFRNMWDKDKESRKMCELTMPAIRANYEKFDRFYHDRFQRTAKKYTSENFNDIVHDEKIDGFVCGSDTIFCIDEFDGFDDGYYANYSCMRKRSVSYAASFGDSHFDDSTYATLDNRLQNFLALGIREENMLGYIATHTNVPFARNVDPTLLLTSNEYDTIVADRQISEKYLLLYTRRYDPEMERLAKCIASEKGLRIIEISLRAANAEKGHIMRYDAGVEEFLSLVKYADYVVTNSFHGLIFAVQYRRPLSVFSREQANSKISELLDLFGMKSSLCNSLKTNTDPIDYNAVHSNIEKARIASFSFLKEELELLCI